MAKLNPKLQRDFSGGQVNNVNSSLTPQNTVELGLNVDFDYEIGSAVSRLGTAIIGAQLVNNNAVLGLHNHIDHASSANNKLFAAINASGDATSVIYDVVVGDTVLGVTGLTASKKVRFLTYGGETLAINGADGERAYNSSAWITTGGVFDLGNFPGSNSCELAAEFLDRIYTAGDSSFPDRLHFSGIFSGTAVAWASDYIDIEPEDGGGAITALAKVPGYLLIFKERSLKRYNGSSTFPESMVQIGTPTQECVVSGGGLCAFYSSSNENAKGFYVTNGGRPIPISHDNNRPIKKWVDAIPQASEANIGGWATEREFCWSVGDLTVDGETHNNVVLKYNRRLNQWSVRTYPTEFRFFASYLVSGVNTIVGGDDDGQIIRIDKAGTYTDAPSTTNISYKLRTKHDTFGFNQLKTITDRVIVRGKNINDANISVIPDEDFKKQVPFGGPTFFKRILGIFGVKSEVEGTSLSVEVSGTTGGDRVYIREIELPNVDVRQNYDR